MRDILVRLMADTINLNMAKHGIHAYVGTLCCIVKGVQQYSTGLLSYLFGCRPVGIGKGSAGPLSW